MEERGINTSCMNADDMRVILSHHEDFYMEKTVVEQHLENWYFIYESSIVN